MTLEVYYRHMPLYTKDVFEGVPAGEKQPGQGEKQEDDFKL